MLAPARQIHFLASVQDDAEALLAVAGGADIVDCKNPARGALGALPVATVAKVRASLPRGIPVSATIGDLPCDAPAVVAAAREMAATGIDYVKVGIFPGGNAAAAIAALGEGQWPCRLVGVLLADLGADFSLVGAMGRAGFAGVMLDTAKKSSGPLTDHVSPEQLADFINEAHAAGLLAGLAGALRLEHVAGLRRYKPDILGFRGALCVAGRASALSVAATRSVGRAVKEPAVPARAAHELAEASAP